MNLHEYLCKRRLTDRDFREKHFAEQIGIDPCYLSCIKSGTVKPGIKLALKIEEATDGQIKALDLVKEGEDVQRPSKPLDSKCRQKESTGH